MFDTLRTLGRRAEREAEVYRRVLRDPRTPRAARLLLGAAIGYLALPVDLVPDVIPVLGQLDDVLIVPGLVWLALRLVPEDVLREAREGAGGTGG